jgi:hypothetical protein
MNFVYLNTTTSGTTPASQLNTDGRAIVLKKLIIGNPVTAGNLTVHYTNVALANDTTTIAFKMTLPTFSTTNVNNTQPIVIDFTTGLNAGVGENGLSLSNGGSVVLDQAMQVTALFDYASE